MFLIVTDCAAEVVPTRTLPKALFERSFPENEQSSGAASKCVKQNVDALVVNEASDEQEPRAGIAILQLIDQRLQPMRIQLVFVCLDSERDDGRLGARDKRRTGGQCSARCDDARGTLIQGPLNPRVQPGCHPLTSQITVVPDHQPVRRHVNNQCRRAQWIWFVQHHAVISIAPDVNRQRRTKRH